MKSHSLLAACALVLFSTLLMKASSADLSPVVGSSHAGFEPGRQAADCGGEPCDAVVRGLLAFFDRRLDGSGGERAGVRRLPHGDRQLPAIASQRRGAVPVAAIAPAVQSQRRRSACSGRSTRMISAPTATVRVTSAIFVRTVWSGSPSRCHRTSGSSIPRPTRPRPRHSSTCGGACPPSTTSPSRGRTTESDGREVRTRRAGTSWTPALTTLQEQALGAFTNHAQVQNVPPQQLLDDLSSFQRVLFTNHRVRALADAVREGAVPLPDPDPSAHPRSSSRARWCSSAPAASATAALGSRRRRRHSSSSRPVIRFHDIATQCPRPVDTATPARFVFAPCPPRLARNARTYEITLSVPTPALRDAPCGNQDSRTSSDPGRALLTGFVGGPSPQDDWNKFDMPGLRGISKTAPYFHNNSAATLEEVVDHYIEFFKRVQATAPPGAPSADRVDGRYQFRPTTEACGTCGISRVPEEALRGQSLHRDAAAVVARNQ